MMLGYSSGRWSGSCFNILNSLKSVRHFVRVGSVLGIGADSITLMELYIDNFRRTSKIAHGNVF
jgi:hypothetical protein